MTAAPALVGLDIGATKVHGVLLVDGDVVAEHRAPARPGPDGLVGTALDAVAALLATAPAATTPAAVGVGVPGLVSVRDGTLAHAVNLDVVEVLPLAALLEDRLRVPVVLENDLNAAALGAAHVLGLDGDLALLALGTGLAAGLLLDGRLRRGHAGAAGEIGHLPYRPGRACPCGQDGCLERYASGSALDAVWPCPPGTPASVDLFRRAGAGEPRAVEVREEFAEAVATAAQTLLLTTDVRHVVLAGGVADVGAPLLEAVVAVLARRGAGSPFLASLGLAERVRLAPPDGRVAPVGAALAAAESLAAVEEVGRLAWRS